MTTSSSTQGFSSTWGFILATIGGAVGLGNIWRFPFIAGENGGGAFILCYFIFIVCFGVPGVIAMIVIGRRGGKSPVASTRDLALKEGHSPAWQLLGWLALTVAFLALSFFSVVAGWILVYLIKSAAGTFTAVSATQSQLLFADAKSDVSSMILWHGVFMIFTVGIVARGVQKGVEKATKLMMPALFLILIVLVVYAAINGEFTKAIEFMFYPDFSKVNSNTILLALGQAFFSLSVGGGGILAYGAYLSKSASIPKVALTVAVANVSVDMLAGLAIFPIVFAYGLQAAAGPGLIFQSLPIAFGQMPGGLFFGTLFFILVFFAALSTSISMLESVVSRLIEFGIAGRTAMTFFAGTLIWLLGLGTVFSFNILSDFKPLSFIPVFRDATIFRIIDFITVNILVMVSAFFLCIFCGWIMSEYATRDELKMKNEVLFKCWRFVMRYLAPVAIATIFTLGLLN